MTGLDAPMEDVLCEDKALLRDLQIAHPRVVNRQACSGSLRDGFEDTMSFRCGCANFGSLSVCSKRDKYEHGQYC